MYPLTLLLRYYDGYLDDFDVIGTVPGFEKMVEAETIKHSKGKLVIIMASNIVRRTL